MRWLTWQGCLRGQRATRSVPRPWPRLFFVNTSPGRRLRLRNVVATFFDSRGARPARASPRREPANRPRCTRALVDLAWLSSRVNARRAPSHAVGQGASSTTLRQVGDGGFETSWSLKSAPVPRDRRSLRLVENRSSAHGAHAFWRTWRGCLRGQRAPRSAPHR